MKLLAAREISLEGQPGAFAGSLMNSSVDLVTRACQGDQEAFRLIFERYSRPVISFIYDQIGLTNSIGGFVSCCRFDFRFSYGK